MRGFYPGCAYHDGHACLARTALPSGRDLGRPRRQLRPLLRARDRRRALPVRRTGRRREAHRIPLPERTDQVWHGYLSGRAARPALRLPRLRALRAAARAPLQSRKLLLDPYARAIGRRSSWDDALFGYTARGGTVRTSSATTGTAPRWRRSAWSSITASPGATTAAPDPVAPTRSSTSCTSRGSPSCIPQVRPELRGTYLGLGVGRRRSSTC